MQMAVSSRLWMDTRPRWQASREAAHPPNWLSGEITMTTHADAQTHPESHHVEREKRQIMRCPGEHDAVQHRQPLCSSCDFQVALPEQGGSVEHVLDAYPRLINTALNQAEALTRRRRLRERQAGWCCAPPPQPRVLHPHAELEYCRQHVLAHRRPVRALRPRHTAAVSVMSTSALLLPRPQRRARSHLRQPGAALPCHLDSARYDAQHAL